MNFYKRVTFTICIDSDYIMVFLCWIPKSDQLLMQSFIKAQCSALFFKLLFKPNSISQHQTKSIRKVYVIFALHVF